MAGKSISVKRHRALADGAPTLRRPRDGGVVVNEKAETGVPGLYAAGDVSCVPKGHLTGAFVFGEIAAENAA